MDDSHYQPNDKSLHTSILVTLLFMVVLVALGLWLHPEETPVAKGPTSASEPELALDGHALPIPMEQVAPKKTVANLLSLPDCRLMPSQDNDADTFWVATNQGQYRFQLYYVDAPDAGEGAPGDTQELMNYFNGMSEQSVRSLARLGQERVKNMLTAASFDVVTRWEIDPSESNRNVTYYAFVMVASTDHKMVNLSSYLVRNGLARIDTTCKEPLPDQKTFAEYLKQLDGFKLRSQESRMGGWSEEISRVQPVGHTRND